MDDDLGMPHTNHRIVFKTMEGDFAAMVTISDLGSDASPVIVEEIDRTLERNLGHLVLQRETFER